jgi:hypothetical protein
MISLFRKIRQKLLQQKQISRYLAYAIGELLLVMIWKSSTYGTSLDLGSSGGAKRH